MSEYPALLLVSEYSQMTFPSPLNPIVIRSEIHTQLLIDVIFLSVNPFHYPTVEREDEVGEFMPSNHVCRCTSLRKLRT